MGEQHAASWSLRQSTIHMPYYVQRLILISGEFREYEQDIWDDVPNSVDRFQEW